MMYIEALDVGVIFGVSHTIRYDIWFCTWFVISKLSVSIGIVAVYLEFNQFTVGK